MDKRKYDRVGMSISCRIRNAHKAFGPGRGAIYEMARAIVGGDRSVRGVVRDISSGGALIEIDRKDFNDKISGGKSGFYMLASDKHLEVELETSPDGEHLTRFNFLPSRIKLSREKIQIGGAFLAGAKTLLPLRHSDARGLVITWP